MAAAVTEIALAQNSRSINVASLRRRRKTSERVCCTACRRSYRHGAERALGSALSAPARRLRLTAIHGTAATLVRIRGNRARTTQPAPEIRCSERGSRTPTDMAQPTRRPCFHGSAIIASPAPPFCPRRRIRNGGARRCASFSAIDNLLEDVRLTHAFPAEEQRFRRSRLRNRISFLPDSGGHRRAQIGEVL